MTTHSGAAMQAAGAWLAAASALQAITFVFHGPPAPEVSDQMAAIAAAPTRWLSVHWLAAGALSMFAVAGLLVLAAGSRLTERPSTISAWAVLPVAALWTLLTAVAEATAVTDAAVAGDAASFAAWWAFGEGMANGFAALALAVTVIAANELGSADRATPAWAAGIGVAAGIGSVTGWALWSWLDVGPGAPVWVASSIVMCLWLAWFGFGLARGEALQVAHGRR